MLVAILNVGCGIYGPPPLDIHVDVVVRDDAITEVRDIATADSHLDSDSHEDRIGEEVSTDILDALDDLAADGADDSSVADFLPELSVEPDVFVPDCGIPQEECTELTWNPATQACDPSVAPDGTPCVTGVCRDGNCGAACWAGTCPPGLSLGDGCHCRVLPTGSNRCLVIHEKPTECLTDDAYVSCDSIKPGDRFWGQDAQHDGRARNFVDQGDGTVLDADTGLLWAGTLSGPMKIRDAEDYCDDAGLPGTGWRLPAIQELFALVDLGNPLCSWNQVFGDECPGEIGIWSRTEPYDLANFCVLHPAGGLDACRHSESQRVRCVKGPLPDDRDFEGRFEVLGNVILDRVTGLAWNNEPVSNLLTWPDALAACSSMGRGWRLPTTAELVSIFDTTMDKDECSLWYEELGERCVDEMYFWSSTVSSLCPGGVFAAHFRSAHIHYNTPWMIWNARCVRSF